MLVSLTCFCHMYLYILSSLFSLQMYYIPLPVWCRDLVAYWVPVWMGRGRGQVWVGVPYV